MKRLKIRVEELAILVRLIDNTLQSEPKHPSEVVVLAVLESLKERYLQKCLQYRTERKKLLQIQHNAYQSKALSYFLAQLDWFDYDSYTATLLIRYRTTYQK